MKEWKINQRIYHTMNSTFADEYGPDEIEYTSDDEDNLVRVISDYMSGWVPEKVVYPAKSYFVALVYARLLRDHFGEDPVAALNDPDLLYNNDPHYQTYTEAQSIYDRVIGQFGWDFELTLGEIPDVKAYFDSEVRLSTI